MAFRDEFREFVNYMQRKCFVCGRKVPKGEGRESVASFRIIHDECFPTLQEMH